MSKSTFPAKPTAAQVREALGIPTNRRGVLSVAEVAAYNKGKRADKRYVPGNTRAHVEATKAQREAAAKAGVFVGQRGPLSNAAKEFLGQSKG